MKDKKYSLSTKKLLARHIESLNNNSKEIDSILSLILSKEIDNKYSCYAKDIEALKTSTSRIEELYRKSK